MNCGEKFDGVYRRDGKRWEVSGVVGRVVDGVVVESSTVMVVELGTAVVECSCEN
jgi:hypothetical protein